MSKVDTHINGLAEFISASPCNFFAVQSQARALEEAGYQRLLESSSWELKRGGKYYVTRNGSALIAFRLPRVQPKGFMMVASHSDSPTLRVKPQPDVKSAECTTLNVEMYGGALLHTWFDKSLSVAGRLVLRDADGIRTQLVNIDRDLLVIPSLAIHMDHEANKGRSLNVQKDLQPLYGDADAMPFMELVAQEADVERDDILGHELVAYNRVKPSVWGSSAEFFSAPRLDDLECAYSSLAGFLESGDEETEAVPVHVMLDNEEVGSGTKQGAASTFLRDVLERINSATGGDDETMRQLVAQSFMLSADNAHAVHPNYTEKADSTHRPHMGKGVVLKHAANQHYTTDAVSEGLVRLMAQRAGVELQVFANRSDMPGGSTLGNLSGCQVAAITADMGIAQLAMHSSWETCSSKDVDALVALCREVYASTLVQSGSDSYELVRA